MKREINVCRHDGIEWVIEQHAATNHMYDYLPYQYHLEQVAATSLNWLHLVKDEGVIPFSFHQSIYTACFAHDAIEDCRLTYNDIISKLGKEVADIVYALTNEKGKTRKERANIKYYAGIREQRGAVFVKLCDRIANVEYSKMTRSSMYTKYQKENANFMKMLGRYTDNTHLEPMFAHLEKLLEMTSIRYENDRFI